MMNFCDQCNKYVDKNHYLYHLQYPLQPITYVLTGKEWRP